MYKRNAQRLVLQSYPRNYGLIKILLSLLLFTCLFHYGLTKKQNSSDVACVPPLLSCDGSLGELLCYPPQWRCDSEIDCKDQSDEPPSCALPCKEDEFRCASGRCLQRGFVCDGEPDCGIDDKELIDASDEDPQLCAHKRSCPANFYPCADSSECIALSKFCDGKKDCQDSSDETRNCIKNPVAKLQCEYGLANTYDGPVCYCPTRKAVANSTSCTWEQTCDRLARGLAPVCEQSCKNLDKGEYECSCYEGYELYDEKRCRRMANSTVYLYVVTTSSFLYQIKLPYTSPSSIESSKNLKAASSSFSIYSHQNLTTRICYIVQNTLECIDQSASSITFSSKRESSINLEGVAWVRYDFYGENWIFSDGSYFIAICSDKSNLKDCRYLQMGNMGHIEDMVIDSEAGYLFYSDSHTKFASAMRLSLDGSKPAVNMAHRSLILPSALAIDPINRVLYYSDRYLESVYAIDYDKQRATRTVVHSRMVKQMSHMIFSDSILYISSRQTVLLFDTFTNTIRPSTEIPIKDHVDGFAVTGAHRFRKPSSCNIRASEHDGVDFCFASSEATNPFGKPSEPAPIYVCRAGAVMTKDGKCIKTTADPKFSNSELIVYARMRPAGVAGFLTSPSYIDNAIEPLASSSKISAITVDTANQRMMAFDAKRLSLIIRDLTTKKDQKEYLLTGVRICEGMTYDPNSDNLYYTDQGLSAVGVFRVSNPEIRRILVSGNMSNPRAIVVHPEKGFLFWGSWAERQTTNSDAIGSPLNVPARIERVNVDETERRVLAEKSVQWPNGLAIDTKDEWLYWADAFYNVIERMRFNGADRQRIISDSESLGHPYGLLFSNSYIYWSELKKGQIWRASNLDKGGKVDMKLVHSENTTIFEIKAYDFKEKGITTKCSTNNGGCEDFCFVVTCKDKNPLKCDSIRCGCREGKKIDPSNRLKCIPDPEYKVKSRCDPQTQFECVRNKKCVSKSSLCDGDFDCEDQSDEDREGVCKGFECPSGNFRCDGNVCLPDAWRCDQKRDCDDNTDEKDCKPSTIRCTDKELLCNSTKTCINREYWCDGREDCLNGEDEWACPKRTECKPNEFTCGNGRCLALWFVCDGTAQCRDGSDEMHCHENCLNGRQFRCSEKEPCMDLLFKCDGVVDCADGSDEDPNQCGNVTSAACLMPNQFDCGTGVCIRKSEVCDGIKQCSNGKDEKNCPIKECERKSDMRCGNRCVPAELQCDGYSDCDKGEDEGNCSEIRSHKRCIFPSYQCQNTTTTCLPKEKVCDGVENCPMGDDEGVYCMLKCPTNLCEQICLHRPEGFLCDCKPGYTLNDDKKTCSKKNPCAPFGACSQYCAKHGSSKHCYCAPGYQLHSDGYTCRAEDRNAFLVYTNRHEVRLLPGDSAHSIPLIGRLRNAIAVDYRIHRNGSVQLYWSDLADDIIQTGLLEGRRLLYVTNLVSFGLFTAEGIAVDWLTGNIYWVDSTLDHIEVASWDGKMRASLLSGNISNVRAIALDAGVGLMFWTDWEEGNARIERATMAGTNRTVLYNVTKVASGGWPNGIVCDTITKRIYWVDAKSDSIHTMEYSGKDQKEIIRNERHLGHPFAVEIFENYVYWTDWRTNAILRTDKVNTTDIALVEKATTQPFSMKIVHRTKHDRLLRNPCSNKPCSHICLIDSPTSNYRCLCPYMMLPTDDGKNCTDANVATIFWSRNTAHVYHGMLGPGTKKISPAFPSLSGRSLEDIRDIVTDGDAIYGLDGGRQHIYKVGVRDGGQESIIREGDLEMAAGLAIDTESGTIYIAMGVSNRIDAITTDGLNRRRIIERGEGMKRPRHIVYMKATGRLLWLDDTDKMMSCSGDGQDLKYVNVSGSFWSPAYDEKRNRVWWVTRNKTSDPVQNLTGTAIVAYDEKTNRILDFVIPLNATAITIDPITGDLVTTSTTEVRRWKIGGKNGDVLAKVKGTFSAMISNSTKNLIGITTIERSRKKTCTSCEYLCVHSSSTTFKCLCPQGFNYVHGRCEGYDKVVIYVNENGKLQTVSFTGPKDNQTQIRNTHSMHPKISKKKIYKVAYDNTRDKLFLITNTNELWMTNLMGTEARMVLDGGLNKLASMIVDEDTGDLLVGMRLGSNPGGVIELINPYKEAFGVRLVEDKERVPLHITVMQSKGFIFWISANCIKRADYTGDNIKCIVDKKVAALSLDPDAERLCYVDEVSKSAVDCVNFDGTEQQDNIAMIKPQGLGDPVSFLIADNLMLFFDKFNMSGTILLMNRQKDGTFALVGGVEKRLKGEKLRVIDLDLHGNMLPWNEGIRHGACLEPANGGCEHLCVTTTDNKPKCLCVASKLAQNGSCIDFTSFVIYSHLNAIEFAHIPNPTHILPLSPARQSIKRGPCILSFASAIVQDSVRSVIYVADYQQRRIVSISLVNDSCSVVAEDVGLVDSLSFDFIHLDLYFTRSDSPGISRVSVADRFPAQPKLVLHLQKADLVRSIAVHPCRMLIFFVNGGQIPSVESVYFSGFDRKRIIEEDLGNPNGISIDFATEKIYFADLLNRAIYRSDLDGQNKETVLASSPTFELHPFYLTIYNDYLLFTDYMKRTIFIVDKVDGITRESRSLIENLANQPLALTVFDSSQTQTCGMTPCTMLNCGDVCRMTAEGQPYCGCNGERRLLKDNTTCSDGPATKKCALNEFLCIASDRCIPYDETCDGYADCAFGDDEDTSYCQTRQCRDGYMPCGDGQCISLAKKCDRKKDCLTMADEADCECDKDKEFRCSSGLCIPYDKECDFNRDCPDASDEMNCPPRNCSAITEFGLAHKLINCNDTTQCIMPEWRCDGRSDCWTGSDEADCDTWKTAPLVDSIPDSHCKKDEFQCKLTGTCMPLEWVCDRNRDCADGSDEKNCDSTCIEPFEFKCPASGKCILSEKKCDGAKDCPGGEDEANCENECTANSTFACSNHRCIPLSWRCDGVDDCLDNGCQLGTDEVNCEGIDSSCIGGKCSNTTVACELTALICDGIKDCENGFDEAGCLDPDRKCPAQSDFMCANGQCIDGDLRCNLAVDCTDGSDEWPEMCGLEVRQRACPAGHYQCTIQNGTSTCLPPKKVCDKVSDCIDGSDEKNCNVNECKLQKHNCAQACFNLPNGYECGCLPGYTLNPFNKETCHREQNCPFANCSHYCVDLPDEGGHRCMCAEGYLLAPNGHDCRLKDRQSEPQLLLVYGKHLKMFNLFGHVTNSLTANLTNGVALDYDYRTSSVYWTDVTNSGSRIGISKFKNLTSFMIKHFNLPAKGVDGIAVDWLGRNIYYTDRTHDAISMCTLDGRFQRTVLKGDPLKDPRAIVVDPSNGILFWTDWGTSAHIGTMRMDGANVKVLLQDRTIRWPNALAVDAPAQRIYWGDAYRDYIGSCNYDGSKRRVVLRNAARHIFALTVFEDFIYWTDWHNHTVIRAHKKTGEQRQEIIEGLREKPMGLKIVHPKLQSAPTVSMATHPCAAGKKTCENLCIPINERTGYICQCAEGFKPQDSKCIADCNPNDHVCKDTYRCIKSWYVCDTQDDCGDGGSDESFFSPGACPPYFCSPGQYQCKAASNDQLTKETRKCLYVSSICDGHNDCPMGDDEDEKFCEHHECDEQHFKCLSPPRCIPSVHVCDGHCDCNSCNDEQKCSNTTDSSCTGASCTASSMCQPACTNGGTCAKQTDNSYKCQCPKGLGGEDCSKVVAKTCGALECANGGICSSNINSNNPLACICPPSWGGLVCRTPTCTGYCTHGDCKITNGSPVCECEFGYTGQRCQMKFDPSEAEDLGSVVKYNWLASIVAAFLVSAVIFVFVLRYSNSLRVMRQFRHSPMRDMGAANGRAAETYSNPVFMLDEGAELGSSLAGANVNGPQTIQMDDIPDATEMQRLHEFTNGAFEMDDAVYSDPVDSAPAHSDQVQLLGSRKN